MDAADTLMPPTAPMAVAQHAAVTPRPTIGFPLGTALLLIVIFCLSGIFSCCYHWDKLRCLHRAAAAAGGGGGDPDDQQQQASIAVLPMHGLHPSFSFITTTTTSPSKIPSKKQNHKQERDQSLPVIMPGDQIPKYMAWPCPCQPTYNLPTTEKVLKEVVIHSSISPN
ncbi:uncharacterized protein At5g65660 [Ananas comosus]|uniref:Uncharacterized protein At5g65660 n=1 Tax=Ananas comosus TaxID=4615 RepID=A0A6P5FFW9_ANACO|nr:uncharacterized protein At5g65660 [Ananas comosus]